ncbi:MAG: hypothetical protein KDD64_04730 [Bdellovibrionales bacterium]|nr:hypothetical protein [Bdellovibrionales bacterium]
MFGFLGKFFLSLLITNWIISEIAIFFPPIITFTDEVTETLALPTHTEWPEIVEPERARKLSFEIAGLFDSSSSAYRWLIRQAPTVTSTKAAAVRPRDYIPVAQLDMFHLAGSSDEPGELLRF